MKEEFLTISEFAKRAGVSRQAIYKRLDGDLQPWLTVDNGKKLINSKALELFADNQNVNQVYSNETLSRMVSMLEKELDIKNKQIDTLNHQVEELNDRLKESHILIGRQQELQAISEKKEEAPAEPAEPIIIEPTPEPAAPDPDEENLSDQEIYKRAAAKLPPMPGLWDRLFEKKVDAWREAQNMAISKMTDKEREVLYKLGFVGDGK